MKKTKNEISSKQGKSKNDGIMDIYREYPGSTRYKLRAEVIDDVFNFIKGMDKIWRIKLEQPTNLAGCTFEFSCFKTLDEIRAILRKIIDSHVMIETVQPIEKYTVGRDFDI